MLISVSATVVFLNTPDVLGAISSDTVRDAIVDGFFEDGMEVRPEEIQVVSMSHPQASGPLCAVILKVSGAPKEVSVAGLGKMRETLMDYLAPDVSCIFVLAPESL